MRFIVFVIALFVIPALGRGAERLSYNQEVRPILSENCFFCHGPDEKHREGGLRLDRPTAEVLDERKGLSRSQKILDRITSIDPEQQMPPHKSQKRLSSQQISVLRRWLEQGANYEEHWAFQPLRNPVPPPVRNVDWSRNGIDSFVLAELERRQILPSPEADRATLVRRVSLDLLGLLPTPETTAAFLHDAQPNAYERLVDRLLDSPHYGERWARHWLDQARYGDSNGYTIDGDRTMWPFRDWVISALNEDLSFQQFTIEQIAGDLLPQPTKKQLIATAFHRNTMINEEGGTDPEQFRNELVVDRTNTTAAVWLGLTWGCAQCHTHKYDPITHQEYYELFAFFNSNTDINNRGATIDVLPGDLYESPTVDAVALTTADAAKKKLETLKRETEKRQTAWEAQLTAATAPDWKPVDIERFESANQRHLRRLNDDTILADRIGSAAETFEIFASTKPANIGALRLRLLPHESLAGLGTAADGQFVLTECEIYVDGVRQPIQRVHADAARKDFPVAAAIDGNPNTGWSPPEAHGESGHEIWWVFVEPLPLNGRKMTIKLAHTHGEIGRFLLEACEQPPQVDPNPERWQTTLALAAKPAAERDKQDAVELTHRFHEFDDPLISAAREADRTAKGAVNSATLMVMKDLPQPRATQILLRGDFLQPDQKTGPLIPKTPAWLPPLRDAVEAANPPNRLELARWLVRNDNPLTPRVTVNRVWMRYFGEGLVETDADFGKQGSPPSHPELLDWLSQQFVQQGWSLKQLQRLIVTSATYRQSSRIRPELSDIDPSNRMLSRQNRVRFDAEIVRDAVLAASGVLDPTLGGPTVRPPQPEGVYAFTQNKKNWSISPGGDRYRRALYTTFHRSAPHPLFTTFDAPNFSSTCTRRPRSNTPLQALTVANDVAFVECAGELAVRLWRELPSPATTTQERVERAFAICLSRQPSSQEVTAVSRFFDEQLTHWRADPTAAHQAAPPARPADLDAPTAAAWTAVGRALFNLDEFITRE